MTGNPLKAKADLSPMVRKYRRDIVRLILTGITSVLLA